MARRSSWIFLGCALHLSACGGSRGSEMDSGTGAPDTNVTLEDTGVGVLPPAAAAALTTAGFGLGVAAALGGPLVAPAQSLRDGGGRLDGAARETRTRTDVESGISGMSVVTPQACATFVWAGLSATVTFTGCTLEATGESIEGSIGVAVSYFPTTFTITFTSLTVGTTQVDGMLSLNVGGACGGADLGCTACGDADPTCTMARVAQQTLTGNLTIMSAGTTVLAITQLTLTNEATGITVNGAFAIDGAEATATDVHWNPAECLPTSGLVDMTATNVAITFLPTTPADGIVSVQVGAFPAFPQALFSPCP